MRGIGIDAGATLTKLALRDGEGAVRHRLEPARASDAVVRAVEASGAA